MNRKRLIWSILLCLGDCALIIAAVEIPIVIRYKLGLFDAALLPRYQISVLMTLSVVTGVFSIGVNSGYRMPRPWLYRRNVTLILRSLSIHALLIITLIFILRIGTRISVRPFLYSRFVVGGSWVLLVPFLILWRSIIGKLQHTAYNAKCTILRCVCIGPEKEIKRFDFELKNALWLGLRCIQHEYLDSGDDGLNQIKCIAQRIKRIPMDACWMIPINGEAWEIASLILCDSSSGMNWYMRPDDFDRFIGELRDLPPPENFLLSRETSEDEIVSDLDATISHDIEPSIKTSVSFIGSRGIPATYGGVEHYVEELSTRLSEYGYRAAVYCRSHYAPKRGEYRGVARRHIPCVNTKHFEAISHTLFSAIHTLFCYDDIVHFNALGPSLLCWLPRLTGKKTVVTIQGLDWKRRKWGPVARFVLKIGEWVSAHLSNDVIVVSEELRTHYRRHHNVDAECIPNGVDISETDSPDLINRYGLQGNDYILGVGRLVPEKGWLTVIRAFKRIQTDKRLVIVGGTSHSDDYIRELNSEISSDRILITGYLYGRILRELFSNAFLFVSASEIEGLPIALLEAMSFSLFPVVSEIPPHRELLGESGRFFRPGDIDSLAAILTEIINNPGLKQMTGQTLQQKAVELFGWDSVVERTIRCYESVL